ncbi:MAG: 50S ribosomal protein L1 [Patescibacteria group bacterium]|nr:50S ribosomal protein L1 [Patescibacteria group bacterium]
MKNSEKQHSKKYRKAIELIEENKIYEINEAVTLVKKTSTVNFDASVECHIRLNIDPANSDQQVRGSLVLPAGTGKTKKVLAIVGSDKEKEAKDSGADFVGGADLIAKIEKGWLDFEVVVATPDMMPSLGKIGKILGTKGLMPNPKVGTVTNDIAKVVKNLKSGMIEYRADKNSIIHSVIGRVSFSETDLAKNYKELIDTLIKVKPNGVKGAYIKSIYLTTSMGPSVRIQQ